MSLYVFYIGKDEKEIQLRINAARAIELEKKLGGDAIASVIPNLSKLSVASDVIAMAISEGSFEERKNKALKIFDDMVSQGKNLIDYQLLVMDVLVEAGFMKGEYVKSVREAQAETQNIATEVLA